MNFFSRYRGVLALVSVIALAVGCTALDGRGDRTPRARAIVIHQTTPADEAGKKQYPPQCDAECQKIWDRMSTDERTAHFVAQIRALDDELDLLTHQVASAPQSSCKTAPSKVVAKKNAKPCGGAAVVSPVPAVSAANQATQVGTLLLASAASAPAFKLADPVPEPRISRVGSYDWMWDSFGYTNGQLVYRPSFGPNKSVSMTEQVADLTKFECPRMKIAGTTEQLVIQLRAAFKPSLLWETDYHRLTAIYGGADNKNVVQDADVRRGVENYLLQHVEVLCQHAALKPIAELLRGELIGAAAALNTYVRKDRTTPFDILVHTTRVVVPQAFVDGLALKYLSGNK